MQSIRLKFMAVIVVLQFFCPFLYPSTALAEDASEIVVVFDQSASMQHYDLSLMSKIWSTVFTGTFEKPYRITFAGFDDTIRENAVAMTAKKKSMDAIAQKIKRIETHGRTTDMEIPLRYMLEKQAVQTVSLALIVSDGKPEISDWDKRRWYLSPKVLSDTRYEDINRKYMALAAKGLSHRQLFNRLAKAYDERNIQLIEQLLPRLKDKLGNKLVFLDISGQYPFFQRWAKMADAQSLVVPAAKGVMFDTEQKKGLSELQKMSGLLLKASVPIASSASPIPARKEVTQPSTLITIVIVSLVILAFFGYFAKKRYGRNIEEKKRKRELEQELGEYREKVEGKAEVEKVRALENFEASLAAEREITSSSIGLREEEIAAKKTEIIGNMKRELDAQKDGWMGRMQQEIEAVKKVRMADLEAEITAERSRRVQALEKEFVDYRKKIEEEIKVEKAKAVKNYEASLTTEREIASLIGESGEEFAVKRTEIFRNLKRELDAQKDAWMEQIQQEIEAVKKNRTADLEAEIAAERNRRAEEIEKELAEYRKTAMADADVEKAQALRTLEFALARESAITSSLGQLEEEYELRKAEMLRNITDELDALKNVWTEQIRREIEIERAKRMADLETEIAVERNRRKQELER